MTGVIFDIDGTLTDSTKVDDHCFFKAFEGVFGFDISNSNWSEFQIVTDWGICEEILFKAQNRNPKNTELERLKIEFTRLLEEESRRDPNQFREIPGASNFIKKLDEKFQIPLGIATGSWEKPARIKLEAIGIDADKYAFSNSSKFKRREEILKDTIARLNHKYPNTIDRFVYFGDGIWDYKTCSNLGIDFIGIDNHQNGKLKNEGAEIVFSDLSTIDPILNFIIY